MRSLLLRATIALLRRFGVPITVGLVKTLARAFGRRVNFYLYFVMKGRISMSVTIKKNENKTVGSLLAFATVDGVDIPTELPAGTAVLSGDESIAKAELVGNTVTVTRVAAAGGTVQVHAEAPNGLSADLEVVVEAFVLDATKIAFDEASFVGSA